MYFDCSLSITAYAFLCSLIIYLIYTFYIKPYLLVQYYKKQGANSVFHSKLTGAIDATIDAIRKGDFFLGYKEMIRKHPNTRFIAENLGSGAYLILTDTKLIQELLKKYDVYQKDQGLHSLLIEVCYSTLILSEDRAWKKKRKLISSAFNFEILKHFVPLVVKTVQSHFQEWINTRNLINMDIVRKFGLITGDLIGRFFFGKKFSSQKLKGLPFTVGMQQLLHGFTKEMFSMPTLIWGPKLLKANILPRHRVLNRTLKEARERCQNMIKEAEASPNKEKTLLSLLLEQRFKGLDEDHLTDEEIMGEFIGLYLAGTETTSCLLGSAIYFLFKYPLVLNKIKKEVDKELADWSKIDIEQINKMEYTSAFLRETLRLAGPISMLFTRVAVKDDDLAGIKIKAGTKINIFHYLYLTSEKYFSRPKEFIPERWLNDPAFNQDGWKSDPYAFIPFSAGPKNCIGQHLAMIETRIVIALFVKTFSFTFPENYKFSMIPRFVFETLEPLLPTLKMKE